MIFQALACDRSVLDITVAARNIRSAFGPPPTSDIFLESLPIFSEKKGYDPYRFTLR